MTNFLYVYTEAKLYQNQILKHVTVHRENTKETKLVKENKISMYIDTY